jgi:hypothetical protein
MKNKQRKVKFQFVVNGMAWVENTNSQAEANKIVADSLGFYGTLHENDNRIVD